MLLLQLCTPGSQGRLSLTLLNRKAFVAAVKRRSEITECLLVAGNLDYVLRVRVRDVDGLRAFILDGLKTIPCVAETSTMLILDSTVAR